MVRTAPFQWTPSKPPSHCALGHDSRGMGDAQHHQMSLHGRVGSDWQLSVNAIHSVRIGPKVRIDQSSPMSSPLSKYASRRCCQCTHERRAEEGPFALYNVNMTDGHVRMNVISSASL